jgi:hypothetical protein
MPFRTAPRSMKTASPLGQGVFGSGTWVTPQVGFGTVIENLVWVVNPQTHPGASRSLSLR